jgi:hypothetical protein
MCSFYSTEIAWFLQRENYFISTNASVSEFHDTCILYTMFVQSVSALVFSVIFGYFVYKYRVLESNVNEQEIILSWSESISSPKNPFTDVLVG